MKEDGTGGYNKHGGKRNGLRALVERDLLKNLVVNGSFIKIDKKMDCEHVTKIQLVQRTGGII
jgi:hypothetical protein